MQKLLLLTTLLVISSCADTRMASDEMPYFDLKGFLEQETAQWAAGHETIKYVYLGDAADTVYLSAYKWTSEMELLEKGDINRGAWKEKYQIDTLNGRNAEAYSVRYQAKEDALLIRHLQVYWQGEEVDSLSFSTAVKTPLHTAGESFHYVPGTSMTFERISDRRLGEGQDLKVVVQRQ
jgi:hypothetical protein